MDMHFVITPFEITDKNTVKSKQTSRTSMSICRTLLRVCKCARRRYYIGNKKGCGAKQLYEVTLLEKRKKQGIEPSILSVLSSRPNHQTTLTAPNNNNTHQNTKKPTYNNNTHTHYRYYTHQQHSQHTKHSIRKFTFIHLHTPQLSYQMYTVPIQDIKFLLLARHYRFREQAQLLPNYYVLIYTLLSFQM